MKCFVGMVATVVALTLVAICSRPASAEIREYYPGTTFPKGPSILWQNTGSDPNNGLLDIWFGKVSDDVSGNPTQWTLENDQTLAVLNRSGLAIPAYWQPVGAPDSYATYYTQRGFYRLTTILIEDMSTSDSDYGEIDACVIGYVGGSGFSGGQRIEQINDVTYPGKPPAYEVTKLPVGYYTVALPQAPNGFEGLLTYNPTTGGMILYPLLNAPSVFSVAVGTPYEMGRIGPTASSGWTFAGTCTDPYSGVDGLLWFNYNTGQLSAWTMSYNSTTGAYRIYNSYNVATFGGATSTNALRPLGTFKNPSNNNLTQLMWDWYQNPPGGSPSWTITYSVLDWSSTRLAETYYNSWRLNPQPSDQSTDWWYPYGGGND